MFLGHPALHIVWYLCLLLLVLFQACLIPVSNYLGTFLSIQSQGLHTSFYHFLLDSLIFLFFCSCLTSLRSAPHKTGIVTFHVTLSYTNSDHHRRANVSFCTGWKYEKMCILGSHRDLRGACEFCQLMTFPVPRSLKSARPWTVSKPTLRHGVSPNLSSHCAYGRNASAHLPECRSDAITLGKPVWTVRVKPRLSSVLPPHTRAPWWQNLHVSELSVCHSLFKIRPWVGLIWEPDTESSVSTHPAPNTVLVISERSACVCV